MVLRDEALEVERGDALGGGAGILIVVVAAGGGIDTTAVQVVEARGVVVAVEAGTVVVGVGVVIIISDNGLSIFRSKRRSRFVTMPISIRLLSTIGMPPMPYSFIRCSASFTSASFVRVTGSIIMPFSALFTFLTSLA